MIVMYVMGQRQRKAWKRIALNLDLKLSGGAWPEGYTMMGKHKDREVLIREVETQWRRKTYTETLVTIDFKKDLPKNIKIIHPKDVAAFVKAYGGQLIQTGNAKIDSALRLEGGDPEQIKSFISNKHIYQAVAGFIQYFVDISVRNLFSNGYAILFMKWLSHWLSHSGKSFFVGYTAAIIEKSAIVCYHGFVRDENILIDIMDRTVSVVEAIEKELTRSKT